MNAGTRTITDLALASYLVASGHSLRAIERTGDRGAFLFTESPALEEAVLRFYNREGVVEPMAFTEMIRNLRGAVRSA